MKVVRVRWFVPSPPLKARMSISFFLNSSATLRMSWRSFVGAKFPLFPTMKPILFNLDGSFRYRLEWGFKTTPIPGIEDAVPPPARRDLYHTGGPVQPLSAPVRGSPSQGSPSRDRYCPRGRPAHAPPFS